MDNEGKKDYPLSDNSAKTSEKEGNNINAENAENILNSDFNIALAGNANVGKSVIFNQLTGSEQIVGNWPGKTVELAKGKLQFDDLNMHVIDLPGIYSFSTFSMEEIVSREFIAQEKPDVVINVLDASVLERNLFFTLQLMEMKVPMVICINQMDVAKQKGIIIDTKKLQKALGIPVVPTVAVRGEGLKELVKTAVQVAKDKKKCEKAVKYEAIQYGSELENRIHALADLLDSENLDLDYSNSWLAIKILENDPEITKLVSSMSPKVMEYADYLARQIEDIHHEPAFSVMASERYALANQIAFGAQKQTEINITFSERLDRILTHPVLGYITSAMVIGGLLLWTFLIGGYISDLITNALNFFEPVNSAVYGPIYTILWNGAFGGFVAGITLIVPFVVPFYILLSYIENSGLLTRVAFMMDTFMHKIGLHGKALIPLILGYGCSVPAIDSTKILENRRERLLAAFAITFAPCAARTIIILSLVAIFVSIWWALALYALDILIIFIMGKLALKAMPGESTSLIMEMHALRLPSLSVVLKQTWNRTKSLIYLVFPLFIIGSAIIQIFYVLGVLNTISDFLTPLTVGWLGLPAFAGVLLLLGIVRKEFILLTLVSFVGTNLAVALTPAQFIVLAIVGMLYIPCLSTIGILMREFGWKAAGTITSANLITAFLVGGLFAWLLPFIL